MADNFNIPGLAALQSLWRGGVRVAEQIPVYAPGHRRHSFRNRLLQPENSGMGRSPLSLPGARPRPFRLLFRYGQLKCADQGAAAPRPRAG